MSIRIIPGDCRTVLPTMPAASVQCCVTSPPYYGLRDYNVDGQIGLEKTPNAYITEMVAVFREVRRVLRDDGTLWLNIGDSYTGGGAGRKDGNHRADGRPGGMSYKATGATHQRSMVGMKPKDLLMIPACLALALQADGWYLRSDIIWAKPNPMPESVTDRPTSSHEHIFLLTKSQRYYYDADAIAEASIHAGKVVTLGGKSLSRGQAVGKGVAASGNRLAESVTVTETRNARNVWTIAPLPYSEAHFATFPPELPERCIKAGTKPGDTVLDPFLGAGTTALVADRLRRDAIGIELNPEYAEMARRRVANDAGMFGEVS